MSNSHRSLAPLVADALAGAWRASPPPPAGLSAAELSAVAPLLTGSGAAPLGWWKIRDTPLREAPPALELREAYRHHTLRAAVRERDIAGVFARLRAANVEAALVKGLAAARAYPEPGLRPFGDIDVCVRPGQFARAQCALPDAPALRVDLHEGFEEADVRPFDEVYARAETLRVGGEDVRVPSAEDHLRLVCVHMLRHGAWRPLWLCDVAAAVEHRPARFDWARLLGDDRRRARWVACAVGLAERLLGARTDDTPLAGEAARLPRWLVPEVLRQWEAPFPAAQAPMRHRAPMAAYLRRPSGALTDLINRWPSPIEATVRVGGPFNELPRMPFQVGYALARAARFATRLPRAGRGKGLGG